MRAISGTRGSSGFGSHSREQIERRTVEQRIALALTQVYSHRIHTFLPNVCILQSFEHTATEKNICSEEKCIKMKVFASILHESSGKCTLAHSLPFL